MLQNTRFLCFYFGLKLVSVLFVTLFSIYAGSQRNNSHNHHCYDDDYDDDDNDDDDDDD